MELWSFKVIVRLSDNTKLCHTFKSRAIPRAGELISVGDSNWEIKSVTWRPTWNMRYGSILEPVCHISFHRDSEGAYWDSPDFWIENQFSEVNETD